MDKLARIVLPEGGEERVLQAAKQLIASSTCHPVLIGDTAKITTFLGESDSYTVLSLDESKKQELQEVALAKGKKYTVADASLAQAVALIRAGDADGIVAGAVNSTSDVVSTYLRGGLPKKTGIQFVSSCFDVHGPDGRHMLWADCGMNPHMTTELLADITCSVHDFAPLLGIEPVIAMLSFETESASYTTPQMVADAKQAVLARKPGSIVEGPMQGDVAVNPAKRADKYTQGDCALGSVPANTLVFPSLDAGNISYKLLQELGGFSFVGPILMGFVHPAHDLSRGCTSTEIVSMVQIAVKQV
jgi:phosphotransacetylase